MKDRILKWNEKLGNDFTADVIYAETEKQLNAIKRKFINDKDFLEMSVSYNSDKELFISIERYSILDKNKEKGIAICQYVECVYSECVSKNDKINNNDIFKITNDDEWVTLLNINVERLQRKLNVEVKND